MREQKEGQEQKEHVSRRLGAWDTFLPTASSFIPVTNILRCLVHWTPPGPKLDREHFQLYRGAENITQPSLTYPLPPCSVTSYYTYSSCNHLCVLVFIHQPLLFLAHVLLSGRHQGPLLLNPVSKRALTRENHGRCLSLLPKRREEESGQRAWRARAEA